MRPSYGVAQYLVEQGYRIIPVNPNVSEALGEKCHARLEDIPERRLLYLVISSVLNVVGTTGVWPSGRVPLAEHVTLGSWSKPQAHNNALRTSSQRSADRLHSTDPKRSRWPNET